MTEELRKIFGPRFEPVGSRVTCNPPPQNTDIDFLCRSIQPVDQELKELGFKLEGSPGFYTGNDNGSFRSWRRGDVNLIVTPDLHFYELFITATSLAKRFNLMDKNDRIALFQAILYGVSQEDLISSMDDYEPTEIEQGLIPIPDKYQEA
jgi:hypothetical protein